MPTVSSPLLHRSISTRHPAFEKLRAKLVWLLPLPADNLSPERLSRALAKIANQHLRRNYFTWSLTPPPVALTLHALRTPQYNYPTLYVELERERERERERAPHTHTHAHASLSLSLSDPLPWPPCAALFLQRGTRRPSRAFWAARGAAAVTYVRPGHLKKQIRRLIRGKLRRATLH
jgi:hypothetical protein